jgi:hypothetical protein
MQGSRTAARLGRVVFDRMKSFSRQTEAAFAVANALKQPAEFR